MRNLGYALLSGMLLALSWPTNGFAILIFFAFVPLLLAEFNIRNFSNNKKWKVFGLAYISFFVWNAYTTYWLYFSTAFGGIFAVTVNALLMALVFLLYHIVAKRTGFTAASAFLVSIWMVFEKMHLNWEFSWPWLNLGNVFSENPAWIQWYEYTGTFGGTLWILLTNIAVFKMILAWKEFRKKEILIRGIAKIILFIGLPIITSYIILNSLDEPEETMEVVILQPNIDPYNEKYMSTDRRIGKLLKQLTDSAATPETELILAPETVFAQGTRLENIENSQAVYFGRMIAEDTGRNFLGGISMYERFSDPARVEKQTNQIGAEDWVNDFNSAFFIKDLNTPVELYHKSKLVVGVENFPYQSVLKPILGNFMIDLGGTTWMKTTQNDREVFNLRDSVATAPIICYESVYGAYVTGYVQNGANFLSIITNDAWWGNTQGHKQHLSYARIRAIETRRFVARSANTGISAVIDHKGAIQNKLGYEKRGAIKGKIGINYQETFYVKYGDYIARVAQFLAIFIFLFAVVKYKRSRPS